MIEIFYTLLLIFAINEIFFVFNRDRLDRNFKNKDITSVKKVDLIHYILKTLSVFWPLIGLFSSMYYMFLFVILLWVLKFVLYHVHKRTYAIYALVLPLVNAALYVSIFFLRR